MRQYIEDLVELRILISFGGSPVKHCPFQLKNAPVVWPLLMAAFALLRYSPQQLYDVVANVDQYQHFVPWCAKSRAFKGESGDFQAELEIGFPPVVERYTSEVTVIPNHKIRVSVWKITRDW